MKHSIRSTPQLSLQHLMYSRNTLSCMHFLKLYTTQQTPPANNLALGVCDPTNISDLPVNFFVTCIAYSRALCFLSNFLAPSTNVNALVSQKHYCLHLNDSSNFHLRTCSLMLHMASTLTVAHCCFMHACLSTFCWHAAH